MSREPETEFRHGDYTVVCHRSLDAVARDTGTPGGDGTPPHCLDWARDVMGGKPWWLEVRGPGSTSPRGFTVTVIPTRALPGHRILRLEQLRFAPDPDAAEAAVRYLMDAARRDGRIVRLNVDTFYGDTAEMDAGSAVMRRLGLAESARSRLYTHTVRIDLTQPTDAILAGLHGTTRRNIRLASKRALELRVVDDARIGERLDAILAETFGRTASRAEPQPWTEVIDYCRNHGDRARLVMAVRTDREGPEATIAFALGLRHGDHVEYAVAGSTRPPDLHVAVGYAVAWELICWARSAGARWFDYGGVTRQEDPADARRGIRNFKLMFGTDVTDVRREWTLVTSPARHAWISAAGWLTERVRRAARALPSSAAATRLTGGPLPRITG